MAVVQNTYTGDGVTVLYSLSFPYLDRSDVKVSVNGTIVTNYIFATDTSIQFLAAPGAGASIRIYRDTDNEETKATIFPGSAIKAQDLNANFSQTLYSVQEIAFRALSKFGDTMLGILNMGGFKITNLGTPTSSTDASTKAYVDGVIATGAANAAAAAASASAAAGSASSAAASYDAFDDRYLGSKSTDPALDNDGNALITGALYFNTSSNVMRVYNGATWQDASANANVLRWRKTAVGGETSLSGADDNAATLTYTVNLEFVYLNGVFLTRGVDYTASNGTSITGLVALEAGDVVEVLSYSSFSLVNVPGSTIQDGTITTNKIANGTILNEDVNASAGIVATKLSFTQAGTGAVARTIDSKLKDVVNARDFGAVGDGVTDDTAALKAAATAALAAGARLWIPKTNSFYSLSSGAVDVTLADGQGLVIESDGAELRQTGSTGAVVISVACSSATTAPLGTNTFLVVRNLIIDGRGVAEQWAETNIANLKTVMGIGTQTEYILIENCRFRKIYGYGVNSSGAYQSEVRNCAFSEVGGHWYQNNTYDAFGDGIYHSRVKANGNVLISHCNIIGYSSNYSRIGCTFEYATGFYNATIEHCLIQKYDRAIHIEENSQCHLTINNCRVIDFRVGIFVFLLSTQAKISVSDSHLQYGSGDYNGSQGWIVFNSSSTPAIFDRCYFYITNSGFVANAGTGIRYYDCHFDYGNVVSILSNHSAIFEGCQFHNIISPGGSHYFFSGTQRFRSCRFYGAANAAFNRNSGTNFEEVIDCVSYGPALSLANLTSSVEYSGVTPSSSQISSGIRATNGTTLYLPAFYNTFPNVDGWIGFGSGSTQNAPRTFTASSATVPSAIWANLSKATLIVKFSDGSAPYILRPETFWDPTAYGRGYYHANIKRNTSGAWVADGAVTTMGNPSAAGFQGTTSDSLTWTGTGTYAWVCQVLIIPRHLFTYIL